MEFLQSIDFSAIFTREMLTDLIRVAAYLVVGFLALRVIIFLVRRILRRRATQQVTMLVTKGINYAGVAALLVIAFIELGVNLTPVLGAAGIVGLAVGIASQTSLSNIISGLFLVSEKPFEIGDVIKVGTTMGIVMSIDLLSVKIRTFDNIFIRIPNQTIASAELSTITRFPIRRMDVEITMAYRCDPGEVEQVLRDLAKDLTYCLDEPVPLVLFTKITPAGIHVLFGVWFVRENFIQVKNGLISEIITRFRQHSIEIAYPHTVVYAGSESHPFPIAHADHSMSSSTKEER
jgi:small-conductance mechanosensitive channel